MDKLDDQISVFTSVYSLFSLLDKYHEKQYLDNLEYKKLSESKLSNYIFEAEKSMVEMGDDYDYHNYDFGIEQERLIEEIAATAQCNFFEEAKELHLLVIVEMKVMFLYKEVEIRLKKIIYSYYHYNKNDLSNLHKLTEHFKNKGVLLNEIHGFSTINELRLVSNDLKHSLKIKAAKRVIEFKEVNNFNSKLLHSFLNRATYDVEHFFVLLIQSINEDNIF